MSDLVSIIIPVYNDQGYLDKTIASLNKQSYNNIEIIIIDDGSKQKITKPKSKFEVTVIRQKNAGAPAARNRGQQKVKGEFILFLDADVTLDKYMIEHLVSALKNNKQAAFSYCNYYFGKGLMISGKFSLKKLQKINYISTMSLIRSKNLITWDESLKRFQDWDYWLRVANSGGVGVWVDMILFHIEEKSHGMSEWIPRWGYWWPFRLLARFKKAVISYNKAKEVITNKYK